MPKLIENGKLDLDQLSNYSPGEVFQHLEAAGYKDSNLVKWIHIVVLARSSMDAIMVNTAQLRRLL